MPVTQRSDYTFRYNSKLGRHGWLRLTPAYSVKLVSEIIARVPDGSVVLDPFSGTATTSLAAAQHGLSAHSTDINPFLVWFGNAKCRNYSPPEFCRLSRGVSQVLREFGDAVAEEHWSPDIHNIDRWWCGHTLRVLSALRESLVRQFGEPVSDDVSSLAWISFCRLAIETSSAAFNHVSMSFQENVTTFETRQIETLFRTIVDAILDDAGKRLPGSASVHLADARREISIDDTQYSHVVTSPPYPNRISYIRELRPYMYWTRFLDTAREAGELDWKAIGGTWGVATSRLQDWRSNELDLPDSLQEVVGGILTKDEKNAGLMAQYVLKYFHDMHQHLASLRGSLRRDAALHYIVGNSSFYGVQVPAEKILEESMRSLGYTNVGSAIVRKRNSKKELFEYRVSATWKGSRAFESGCFGNRSKRSEAFVSSRPAHAGSEQPRS